MSLFATVIFTYTPHNILAFMQEDGLFPLGGKYPKVPVLHVSESLKLAGLPIM